MDRRLERILLEDETPRIVETKKILPRRLILRDTASRMSSNMFAEMFPLAVRLDGLHEERVR
jgi:chromosome condensin MukBEF ATPase and DNA-binding subunit MukB